MLLDYLQTVLLIAKTAQEWNITQHCVLVYVICVNTNSNIVFKILWSILFVWPWCYTNMHLFLLLLTFVFFTVSIYLFPHVSWIFQAPVDCNILFYLFVYTVSCLKFYWFDKNCTYQWSLITLGTSPAYLKIVIHVNSNLPYCLNCNQPLCLIT